ncbi:MAG: TetR/AcrR family transcriptional regulator [OCS116 cluster bacterium]|nr:TetR/AcrR family transcriptional regulator [OCS116 cluster bacterium]
MNEKYHHGDLFAAVIEQAFEIIEADGYASFSIRSLARQIGVDSAAIYRHFKSKETVAAQVAKKGFATLAQDMQDNLNAHTDATEKMVAIGVCYIDFAIAHPNLFELMFNMVNSPHYRNMDCEEDPNQSPSLIFSAAWHGLLKQQSQPQATAATGQFSLWSAVHGCAMLLIQGHGPQEADLIKQYSETVCRNMVRGCLAL